MKKIISLILAIAIFASIASVAYAEEAGAEFQIPEKVEISFKVGDSTLMINGNAVEVETPYIAGEGTTLVPLRVITEAFGAKVTWVNETKEIILEYPDVNITLQIDNVSAKVNEHTEALPVAPVLSPNGVTMVPLRFISETFGATVGYDNATAAITVVKEVATEEDGTLSTSTDLPRVGDSYWNWSMMTPSSMMMTDRLTDGCYTMFEGEESAKLSVNIIDISDYEGSAYDDRFNAVKTDFSGFTFSRSDKSEDAFGNKCFRITARDKEYYVDIYTVFKGDYYYQVAFTGEKDSQAIAPATAIVDSFKLEFAADEAEKAQTHNLSNVGEDGYRVIKNEELGISFKVPATCIDNNPSQLNLIYFTSGKKNDPTEITVGLYTKSEDVSAKLLAENDCKRHKDYYNAQFCSVSNVNPYTTTAVGENAVYYWMTTNGLYGGDYELYDVFFENGDYVYNVTVTVPAGKKETYQLVMDSLSIEPLDSEEAGIFLRNSIDETPVISSCADWSIEISSMWQVISEPNSAGAAYYSRRNGSILTLDIIDAGDIKSSDMKELVGEFSKEIKGDGKITEKVEKVNFGTKGFYTFQFYTEGGDLTKGVYQNVYMLLAGGDIYMFRLTEEQEVANSKTRTEVEKMIESFEIK